MASTATIHTTTQGAQLRYPGARRIDRQTSTGHLFYVAVTNAGNEFQVYRSTDKGVSWSAFGPARTVEAAIQEMGGFFVDWRNRLYITYRTNVSSQDRVWMQAGVITASVVSWHTPLLLASAANGGTPGSYFSGMAPLVVRHDDGRSTGFVAVGHQGDTLMAVRAYGFTIPATSGQPVASNTVVNKSLWSFSEPAGGHQVPAVGYESNPAHAWIAWGRTYLWTVKLTWNGSGWTGPNTAVRLSAQGSGIPAPPAMDSVSGVWRNPGWLVAQPYQYDTTQVVVWERNAGNTNTTGYITPAHPAGVVKHCVLSYNNVTRDFRVYAVGTANPDLHYVDYIQATGTWSGWSTVSTNDVANFDNYSVRRESYGSARYDLLYMHGASPFTVTHVSQDLTYPPFAPAWRFGIGGNSMPANGAAAAVTAPLDLVWSFSDPDPADAQTAWALSRQIGTGTIQYFRASDSTWQAAEVKNVGATSSRTLAAGWGLTTDPNHSYRVKVWDASDTPSVYSAALVVVPSGKVNPTITSPTPSQVITQDRVTVTWTVAEQTAYRVRVQIFADVLYDSGWRAGTDTSHTPDLALGDGFGYSIFVETRNAEGLASDAQQVNITVDFVEPATATVVLTPLPELGVIRATITNPTPQPLNSNPYLESGIAGWLVQSGGSIAHAPGPDGALLFTPDGVTATVEVRSDNAAGIVAGQKYRVPAVVACAVARSVNANIVWRDGAGTFISSAGAVSVSVAANTPTPVEVSGIAPAGAAQAQVSVSMGSTPPNTHLLRVYSAPLLLDDGRPAVASQELYRRPLVSPWLFEAGFETADMSMWGPPSGATAARSNTLAKAGSWSYQLTATGTSARVETVKIPCTPNVTYWLEFWATSSVLKDLIPQFRWYDGGGGFLGAVNGILKPPPAVNVFDYRWVSATAPANATHMTLNAALGSSAAPGDLMWVDEMRMRVTDPALGVRVASGLPANATYDDWQAASGVAYEYRVQTRGVNNATVGGVWTS